MAIEDERSARSWVKNQTHDARIAFAARCALRALSAIGMLRVHPEEIELPWALRASLIVCCAANRTQFPPNLQDSLDILKTDTLSTQDVEELARACISDALTTVFEHSMSDIAAAASADWLSAVAFYAGEMSSASTYDQLEYSVKSWRMCDTDAQNIDSLGGSRVFKNPLWRKGSSEADDAGEPAALRNAYQRIVEIFDSDPQVWGFWKRWLEGMRNGQPMDWALQEQVALIPDEVWEAGPEAVAERIDEIEKRFALKDALRKAETNMVRDAAQRLGIGGNKPPEKIEDLPPTPEFPTMIWEPFETIKEEVEKAEPDLKRTLAAIEKLKAFVAFCTSYSGKSLDNATQSAVKVIGGGAGVEILGWISGHGSIISKVIEAAQSWIGAFH